MTNPLSINVMSTVSIYSNYKKITCEKNNCLKHTISLVVKYLSLLVTISISWYYYYTRHRIKNTHYHVSIKWTV